MSRRQPTYGSHFGTFEDFPYHSKEIKEKSYWLCFVLFKSSERNCGQNRPLLIDLGAENALQELQHMTPYKILLPAWFSLDEVIVSDNTYAAILIFY